MQRWFGLLVVASALHLAACAPQGPPRKATFPVSGVVVVDGQEASGVTVTAHDTKGMDPQMPTYSSATTDESGKFSFSTYAGGDGVPEGDYVLTFSWGEFNPVSRAMQGDKLKGRYSDKDKSTFKLKVEGGKVDLGRIELSTQ